jgi:signal transduction histidine kinase
MLFVRVIVFLFCGLIGWSSRVSGEPRPMAEQGMIDASAWDFEKGGLPLRGQWMFHWKRLFTPDEIKAEAFLKEKSFLIPNPSGSWDALGGEITAHGWATYVLQIKGLKTPARDLSITFGQFANAHKTWLYIPSRQALILLADVGVVSDREEKAIPQSRKVITALPELDGSDVYLVMGTSFFLMPSAFSETPVIDRSASAIANDQLQLMEACFVLGMFFLLVISNGALFLLRTEDKPSLLMAGFSLVMGLRYVSTEAILSRLFPEATLLNFSLTAYPNLLAFPLGMACYFHFFHLAFPGYFPKKAVQLGWAASLLYGVLALIFPKYAISSYGYFLLPTVGLALLMFWKLARATWQRVRGASMALLGIAVLVAAMTNDVVVFVKQLDLPFLGHYGMVAFIFCQSLVVGSNFAFAFRTADKLSKALQVEVARQTRDVKMILKNIHQGIFTIRAPGLMVGDDYSSFLERILETKTIKDRNAMDLVFAGSDLNAEQKSMVQTILEGSIEESPLNFELNQDNLIREMHLRTPSGQEKILLMDWQPVVDEGKDVVEKMLVTLRDVTELKAMELQNRKQQRDIELIGEIIEINPEKFDIFMKTGRNFIAENRRLIEGMDSPDAEALKILFINMHTIKGAARTYRFKSMTALVHDCEQTYAQVQKKEAAWNKDEALAQLSEVEKVFEEYDRINRLKLKRNESLDVVKIDLETVRENIKYLQELEDFKLDERMTPFVDHVRRTFYHLYYMEVEKVFEDIFKPLPTLAKDLKKPVPKVSFSSVAAGISNEGCEVLRNIFVHILRNSMDHGIEDADTRLYKGKKPDGHIHVDISLGAKGYLQILYGDDGTGLRLDRIRDLGVRQGLILEQETSPQKIAELIFMAGFSTAKAVNDISGRGVGMSAVREYLQKMGGDVKIHLIHSGEIKPTEFEFEIILPSELFTIFKEEKRVA